VSLALDKNLGINEPFRTARRVVPVAPVSPCDNDPRRPRPLFESRQNHDNAGSCSSGPATLATPTPEYGAAFPSDEGGVAGVGRSVDVWM